ncbi:MFS transporter [Streptomyces sp. UNOC14_S4]|uniref:MFS transporter n=1 Tax=Streptomyces sp. UNOC14_S4 TaxID=2872340 RepID=UPI001E5E5A7B|nr:MFS transporter [Streptomyces sp. UNOC14_S4]MCC3767314.1 MFS transporter [Streptomyces sp. UNOC14_S4]
MYGWRIWLFLGARLFSTLGDQILQFAVPLIVYAATGSVSLSGLAFMIEWLPRLVSLPFAGVLSDRFGGRRIYAASDSVRAVACFGAVLAVLHWPGHTFALTAVLMALCAFCYAQSFIALETTVPELVPEADLAKAQSLLQMINNGSSVFGPALGGALLFWAAPTQLLWVVGAMFAVSACSVVTLKELGTPSAKRARDPERSVARELRAGVRGLVAAPVLLSLVGLGMVVNLMVGLAMTTGAALSVGHFKVGNSAFASLQMTVGALSLVTFFLMPWLTRRFSVYRIGAASFAASAFGGLLIGLGGSFPVYVAGYGLCIGLCGLFNVFIRVERLHWIAPEERGRVISFIVLLNQSTMPVAGLLVAVTGGALPVQWLFLATGIVACATYVFVFRPLRSKVVTAQSAAVRA